MHCGGHQPGTLIVPGQSTFAIDGRLGRETMIAISHMLITPLGNIRQIWSKEERTMRLRNPCKTTLACGW